MTDIDWKARAETAETDNAELNFLFELQQTRTSKATIAWRAANPGNDHVSPDLGDLLDWLLEERGVCHVCEQRDAAHRYRELKDRAELAERKLHELEEEVDSAKGTLNECAAALDIELLGVSVDAKAHGLVLGVTGKLQDQTALAARQSQEDQGDDTTK